MSKKNESKDFLTLVFQENVKAIIGELKRDPAGFLLKLKYVFILAKKHKSGGVK